MIPLRALGINHMERNRLKDALAGSYSMRVTVLLCNLNGDPINDLSDRLLDGQVDVDATAEVTRSCTLTLLDPQRTLAFASDSPSEGAIYLDRMMKVYYGVYVDDLEKWVDIPVFTGPITKLDRAEDVVNVEAQGKEALARGSVYKVFERKKGTAKVDVIHDILHDRCGERDFDLPNMPKQRLPRNFSMTREQMPWQAAKKLARSLTRQLFYDGDGVCRMRAYPSKSIFEFKEGNQGTITTSPQVSYTSEELRNIVLVIGGPPGSAKKKDDDEESTKKKVDRKVNKRPVEAVAEAPDGHPVSPATLGRNGTKLYLLDVVRESSIMTKKAAQELADRRLRKHLLEHVEVSFDAMPVPFLEENDVVSLKTENFSGDFVLKRFTIPLVAGNTMSFGYNKRMPYKGTRRRRNNRKNSGGKNKR